MQNHGFFKQLIDYERALRGSNSLTMSDLALCPFCSRTSVFSVRITCGHNSCHSCFIRKFDEYNAARTLRAKASRSVADRLADCEDGSARKSGDGWAPVGDGCHTSKATMGGHPAGVALADDKEASLAEAVDDDDDDCGLLLGEDDGGGGDRASPGPRDDYGFGLCISDTARIADSDHGVPRPPGDAAAAVPGLHVDSSALLVAENNVDKVSEATGQGEPRVNSEGSSPGNEDPASATTATTTTVSMDTTPGTRAGFRTPTWAARSVDEYEDVEGFARRLVALAAEEGFELHCPQCDYMRGRQSLDRSPSVLEIGS